MKADHGWPQTYSADLPKRQVNDMLFRSNILDGSSEAKTLLQATGQRRTHLAATTHTENRSGAREREGGCAHRRRC